VISGFVVPRTAFSAYAYPDPDDPIVVAVDTIGSDLILTAASEVTGYVDLYRRLVQAALPPDDSLEYLTELSHRFRER
jgi:Domain of unknown function (DUF5753)